MAIRRKMAVMITGVIRVAIEPDLKNPGIKAEKKADRKTGDFGPHPSFFVTFPMRS